MNDERVKTTQTYQTQDGLHHETMEDARDHADWLEFKEWVDDSCLTGDEARHLKSAVPTKKLFEWLKKYAKDLPMGWFTDEPVKPDTRETELSNRVKHLEGVLRMIQAKMHTKGEVWGDCNDALYSREGE